jgi:hypothetical protein
MIRFDCSSIRLLYLKTKAPAVQLRALLKFVAGLRTAATCAASNIDNSRQ